MDTQALKNFYYKAALNTYVGGAENEKTSERPRFFELAFSEGEWAYRDSYAGFYRSAGSEIIRFQDKPVWYTSYGGGMAKGKESMALATFEFLKEAMKQKPTEEFSARGPVTFTNDKWEYRYTQQGTLDQFTGYEQIFFNGEMVFDHNIIGGLIVSEL